VTDIWLCILPFTALVQIQEKRLRTAVFCVYGLALVDITVGIIRATLLAVNAKANVKYIFSLTAVQLAVTIIIAALPGISSVFTRKYIYNSSNKSTQDWTHKRSTLKGTHPDWKNLDVQFNEFSVSADNVELRTGGYERRGSTIAYSTDAEDAISADRIEKGGPVAATMI
jgi:hypothetical protein